MRQQRGAGAATETAVPERPALAPDVELGGPMQDTGFEDQQWMVLRDGSVIQLTELLYRVAEQANGERTLEEIAGGVGHAIGRKVSADNVRQLIASKLIPLGLVAKADGNVERPRGADGASAARSPLSVNMRMAMISPRVIEPVATVFQVFFFPPILLGLLAIGLLALGWLFFIHGLGQSFGASLNQPWLILVLLPVIVGSAAFHEFGHAAALKYGGGKVRGMGAGFYLMYPAFFTDVTDNYRLSRWARVRTDTGGFYFHLLFGLAVMAIYLLTRQEFLLVVVFFIVLQIVHQAMPFVRLDGYWTLADLTGIPDLFSNMGPFLRSLLPFGGSGRRLPNLKAWVKLVFVLYILITIPLLAVLAFLMITRAPSVLATALDSFAKQLGAFGAATSGGDWIGATASVLGMLVLLLTTAGFAYFLFSLVRGVARRVWSWGRQSRGRAVVASFGSLTVVGLLVYLWAPPLAFTGGRPGPLHGLVAPFRPIEPGERWTVQESFGGEAPHDFIAPPVPAPPAGGTLTRPAPAAATPVPSGQPGSETPAATATPTPDHGGGSQTTRSPSASATPSPTATSSPSPTPTP